MFDVIVTLNLYGDVISDVAAEISGSVGLAGSANIGDDFAMFEAIHGSAPDIAGKNIANPTGLINAAIMMLVHLEQFETANLIKDALNKTIEDGIHTADIYNDKNSNKKVGTAEFTDELIARLGQKPATFAASNFTKPVASNQVNQPLKISQKSEKSMIGFDLYIDWQQELNNLIAKLNTMASDDFEIKSISAKGLLLWPHIDKHDEPNYNKGQTVLRFVKKGITGKNSVDIKDSSISCSNQDMIEMLQHVADNDFTIMKIEGLYIFDGQAGYTPAQGE